MTELLSTCSQCACFVIVGPPTSRPGYWSLASQIKRHAVRRLTTPLLPPDHIKPTFSSFTPTIIFCKIWRNAVCLSLSCPAYTSFEINCLLFSCDCVDDISFWYYILDKKNFNFSLKTKNCAKMPVECLIPDDRLKLLLFCFGFCWVVAHTQA
jgi:hypothetical protein